MKIILTDKEKIKIIQLSSSVGIKEPNKLFGPDNTIELDEKSMIEIFGHVNNQISNPLNILNKCKYSLIVNKWISIIKPISER